MEALLLIVVIQAKITLFTANLVFHGLAMMQQTIDED